MFSLIITVISIALVAALALATLYYGGAAFGKGASRAEAAKLVLQGQQLLGAADLYYTANRQWPASIEDLVQGNYLKQVPQAQASGLTEALAAQAWTMVPNSPTFHIPTGALDVCAEVNLSASLRKRGVLRTAYTGLVAQCYGETNLTTVFRKTIVDPFPAGTPVSPNPTPPVDPTDPEWVVEPGAPTEPPVDPTGPETVEVVGPTTPLGFNVTITPGSWTVTTPANTVATRVFTVRNNGAQTVEIWDVSLTTWELPFMLAESAPDDCYNTDLWQLPAGQTCTVTVVYVPRTDGVVSTDILNVEVNNGTESQTTTVPLQGTSTAATASARQPFDVTYTPATVNFGNVGVNSSVTQIITVTNRGLDQAYVYGYGDDYDLYEYGGSCDENGDLWPGQSCQFTITFSPTAAGAAPNTFWVGAEQQEDPYDWYEEPIPVTANGVDTPVNVSLSQTTFNFGSVPIGNRATQMLTVTNNGTQPMTLAFLENPFSNEAYYRAIQRDLSRTIPMPAETHNCTNVAPNQSCQVAVNFNPLHLTYTDNFLYNGEPKNLAKLYFVGASAPVTFNLAGSGLDYGRPLQIYLDGNPVGNGDVSAAISGAGWELPSSTYELSEGGNQGYWLPSNIMYTSNVDPAKVYNPGAATSFNLVVSNRSNNTLSQFRFIDERAFFTVTSTTCGTQLEAGQACAMTVTANEAFPTGSNDWSTRTLGFMGYNDLGYTARAFLHFHPGGGGGTGDTGGGLGGGGTAISWIGDSGVNTFAVPVSSPYTSSCAASTGSSNASTVNTCVAQMGTASGLYGTCQNRGVEPKPGVPGEWRTVVRCTG